MKSTRIQEFREKISTGPVLGPFSKTEDPAFVEAMGFGGMDFVILDLEHGPNSVRSIQNLVRAAEISGVLPIVRVKEGIPNYIGEILDIGAMGVQVPQITCADEARSVIRAAKFSPHGERGVCRFVRAADYSSKDRYEYFRDANDALIILQVEGQQAIANLDDILLVDGIDIIFIGPYDLSQSIGYPGEIDHPKVAEQMNVIIEKCQEYNVVVGTFVDTIENAQKWQKHGVRYISYSVDIGIFTESCKVIKEKVLG